MNTSDYITIPLTQGQETIIDACDADFINQWNWCARKDKWGGYYVYRTGYLDGKAKTIFMHREILARILGRDLLKTEYVDHADNNTLNNSRTNLRLANKSQNNMNRKAPKTNTTGFKGVGFDKRTGKYFAQIQAFNKKYKLGYYNTPEEAFEEYKKAALKLHGEFAKF